MAIKIDPMMEDFTLNTLAKCPWPSGDRITKSSMRLILSALRGDDDGISRFIPSPPSRFSLLQLHGRQLYYRETAGDEVVMMTGAAAAKHTAI